MAHGFPKPAPDFSDPIGLILACHQRMLGHCELLEKLAQHLQYSGADDDARQAAQKVHRYFSTAARHHHDDEEQDVFPRVLRAAPDMANVIQRLQQDHERLDAAWADIGPMLAEPSHIGDTEQFADLVANFCTLYRAHIQSEEEQLFARIKPFLNADDLQQIGAAMRQRRQA